MTAPTAPCPCHSGATFADCCEPLVIGQRGAPTALALMRSRYTAYVLRRVDYLLATWHPTTRPAAIDPTTIPDWQGLHIVRTERGDETDSEGLVEFVAVAMAGRGVCRLHEVSRFVREEGRWFYSAGELKDEAALAGERRTPAPGRNKPCPCGSGKKYKKCCGP